MKIKTIFILRQIIFTIVTFFLGRREYYFSHNSDGKWLMHPISFVYQASNSLRWKDIIKSGFVEDGGSNWFVNLSNWNARNIDLIFFWNDVWAYDSTLKSDFYNLFLHSWDDKIYNMGEWNNNVWRWNLQWIKPLEAEELA